MAPSFNPLAALAAIANRDLSENADVLCQWTEKNVQERMHLVIQRLRICATAQRPQSRHALIAWLNRAGKCQQRATAFIVDPVEVLSLLLGSDMVEQSKLEIAAGVLLDQCPVDARHVALRPADATRALHAVRKQKACELTDEALIRWAAEQAFVSIMVTPEDVLAKLVADGVIQESAAKGKDRESRLSYHLPELERDAQEVHREEAVTELMEIQLINTGSSCEDFDDLNLSEDLLRGIYSYGFERPSWIQQWSMRPLIDLKSTILQCSSGMGKTAAFVIPILQRLNPRLRSCQALIVAPGRELVNQIQKVVLALGDYMRVRCHSCIGGTSVRDDIDRLREGQHVIVGACGRLFDMISKRHLRLDDLRMLVVDEADDMLNAKNSRQVLDICKHLPKNVQFCLSGTTMTAPTLEFMKKTYMPNHAQIFVPDHKLMTQNLSHFYIECEQEDFKLDTLCDLLTTLYFTQLIVFCSLVAK